MAIPEDVKNYMRAHAHHGPGAAVRNRQVMRDAWAQHRGRRTAQNPDTGQIVKVGLFLGLGYLALKALGILKPPTTPSPDGQSTLTAGVSLF